MAQIINPGDSMSYRKGTVFLMFHQEDITVKIFNGEMRNISWDQFFTYTQEIFAEAAAGAKTYENNRSDTEERWQMLLLLSGDIYEYGFIFI